MLPIHFAPIQGQTDLLYRTLHHQIAGDIEQYYTPFVRWEKGGLRNKDLRDIDLAANASQPTAVQIIFRDRDEFLRLTEHMISLGWKRIDLNLGCPFPLQTHAGRGCGILQHPEIIEQIVTEILQLPDINFSVKMRLGLENEAEGLTILPILDAAHLCHITLHARLGIQQYKGRADLQAFERFYTQSATPMIYNGDITTPQQIRQLEQQFPNLAGVMIGRGLLQRPTLAQEYLSEEEYPPQAQLPIIRKIHDGIFDHSLQRLQGDSQILSRMQSFWEPYKDVLDKKLFKQLTRCGTLRSYREALTHLPR